MTARKQLLFVIGLISLIAAACGSAADSASTDAPAAEAGADTEATVQTELESTELDSDVLALVVQSIEDLSYSYEQGLSIEGEVFGQELDVTTDEAFASGEVEDDDLSINVDIGSFVLATLESTGIDASEPLFESFFRGIAEIEIDVWVVDGEIVLDLTDFANTWGGIDPTAASELSIFQDGPVSVDIERLAELGVDSDVDVSDLLDQFAQGAPIIDPSSIVDLLSSIDALEDAGTGSVNGVDVDVYNATVSLADYAEALGQDPLEGLGPLDGLGLGSDELDDAVDAEALLAAVEDLTVDLTLSIDGDELVREIVTTVDTGALLSAATAELDDPELAGGASLVVQTWQTFDNYGEDFDIVAPEAVDVTNELAGLIDS